ncbi:hypothetical protein ACJ73_02468 [Blastomyces percursus]|uniref:Myb-like domain-containing protein n=1 Tax=Blastomyces percursus TaxID=1658174 RepID=A0A1J9QBE3_9EURO|nr:hypothetical protein ACJ73_02468 [Blastomyces percursus]
MKTDKWIVLVKGIPHTIIIFLSKFGLPGLSDKNIMPVAELDRHYDVIVGETVPGQIIFKTATFVFPDNLPSGEHPPFIHGRELDGSIYDCKQLCVQALSQLQPGGYFELQSKTDKASRDKRSYKKWSLDEEARITRFYRDRLKWKEIGMELGRSAETCQQHFYMMQRRLGEEEMARRAQTVGTELGRSAESCQQRYYMMQRQLGEEEMARRAQTVLLSSSELPQAPHPRPVQLP